MHKTKLRARRPWILLAIALLSLTLVAGLAACAGGDDAQEPAPVEETAAEVVAEEEAPTAEPVATEEPTEAPAEEATAEPEEASPEATREHTADPLLVDVTWEWVSRDPNGNDIDEITVDMPENYTLLFNEDGTFSAKVDCNNVFGSYATSNVEDDYRSIFMEAGPSTMAFCGEDSLDQAMIQMFGPAQNYFFENDGDTLVFPWVAAGPIDTFQKAAAADEETTAPSEEDLDSTLANMTYTSEFTQDGTVTLVDGTYEEAAAPGSATMTTVTLLPEYTATGELEGEPAAAVVLVTNPGGSGTFYDLAVVMDQDGEPVNVATTLLGDRVRINSVAIENSQIVVDMVTPGPDDPLCCPTLQVVQTYALQDGELTLVDTQEIGPVAAEAEEPAIDADDPDPVAEDAPEIDLPDAEAGEPRGVVTAPAGVNIRTGPGTDYSIIGMAPQGAEGEIVGKSEDGQWWVAVAPDAPSEYGWVSAAYVDATNADNVPVIPAPPSPAAPAAEDAELSDGDGYDVPADVLIFSASRRVLEGNRAYELEDVYVVPAKPGSESVLAANNAMQPALSPDRQTLAFRSMQSDKFGLGGYDLDTGQRLRFSRFNEDSNPRWSPSGDRMVYASNKEGDRAWRIYITEAVAKENPADMTFAELGPGLDPDWHPTEELIVFKGCNEQGQECGLYTMGTDGSNRAQLTNVTDDSRPRWLPNGSGIVFMSKERDGNWELYRANADGSEVVRLTKFAAADGLPAVSPDGSQIAFFSNRDGGWGIWIMRADGGGARMVTPIPDEQPDWLVHGIDWVQ